MKFQEVTIQIHPSGDLPLSGIRSDAPLADVVFRTASEESPYLVVEDDTGAPMGVISMDDVLQPSSQSALGEIAHWLDRPVESALSGRLKLPSGGPREAIKPEGEIRSTLVTHDDSVLGLMTGDDLFVSWRAVRNTLRVAQGDFVTGLPGRAIFEDQLRSECGRAIRSGQSVGVLLVDIDRFKSINDEFGHAAGDLALRKIGRILKGCLRSFDLVARYGGDEFAVLCSGCGPGEVDAVAARVLRDIRQLQVPGDGGVFTPSVSIGAGVAHDVSTLSGGDDIVLAADVCLYAAKDAGRDCAWKSEFYVTSQAFPVAVDGPDPV